MTATTLTPTPPIAFAISRMRKSVAEATLFSDGDVTQYWNEGYASACERSKCLRAYVTIPLIVGGQEYTVPADWSSTIAVYRGGARLLPLPLRIAARGDDGDYYYEYEGKIGIPVAPATLDSLILYYARVPATLTASDTPEQSFGPEWYHVPVYYAKWKMTMLAGGAQNMVRAAQYRARFEDGVTRLRAWASRGDDQSAASSIRSLQELTNAG